MDRELMRKIVALIDASTAVLNAENEEVSASYHLLLMAELFGARDELRDEIFSGIHDS